MLINAYAVYPLIPRSAYYYHFQSPSGWVKPSVRARLGGQGKVVELELSSVPNEYENLMIRHRLLLSETGELQCVLTFEERWKTWNQPHGVKATLRESRKVLTRKRRQLELAEPCILVLEIARGHNPIKLLMEDNKAILLEPIDDQGDRHLNVQVELVSESSCYGRVLDGPVPGPDTSRLQQVAIRPFHGLKCGDVVCCQEVGIGVYGEFLDPSSTIVKPELTEASDRGLTPVG